MGLEWAGLQRSDVLRGAGVPAGDGRGVLLIPGFLAGDGSLGVMTGWLRRAGYRTKSAGMRANIGCSAESYARIEERLERHVENHGPAIVIGQSRGGHFAKALAALRPDLVRGIVTLGTPMLNPYAVHPVVLLQVGAVGALGTLGVPRLFRNSCRNGGCCKDFWATQTTDLPDGIRYVAVYSKRDGVVDWRSCLDPGAEHVEVNASHCGMAVHAGTYRAVAEALQAFDAPLAPVTRLPRAA